MARSDDRNSLAQGALDRYWVYPEIGVAGGSKPALRALKPAPRAGVPPRWRLMREAAYWVSTGSSSPDGLATFICTLKRSLRML